MSYRTVKYLKRRNRINMPNNFIDLIKKYSVKIPIIQRDYVQGRMGKIQNIGKIFIEELFKSLINGTNINLNFIYGRITEDNTFEPIDGQQRLTTMFLVTLFIAVKEKKTEELKEFKDFSYAVRESSEDFCAKLKNNLKTIPENIKDSIKNEKWFIEDWEDDQTIMSMLEVLQLIQNQYEKQNQNNIYDNLKKITFEFIDTTQENLNDDTYIKLNARGVPLSSFEEYKTSLLEYENFRKLYEKDVDNSWNNWIWSKIDKKEYEEDNKIFDNSFTAIFRTILTNEFARKYRITSNKTDENGIKLEEFMNLDRVYFSSYKEVLKNDMDTISVDIGRAFEFFINHEKEINDINDYIDIKKMLNDNLILGTSDFDKNNRK